MRIEAPTKTHIPALRALWREAFSDSDAFLDRFFGVAFSPDRCRLATEEGGTLAAALYWLNSTYEGGKVAYLYAIATAKAYRGRGICSSLMADTHRHLSSLGYVGAALVPSTPSLFPFYERMGYSVCGRIREFSCPAAKEGLPIERIGAAEYGALRRSLLPKGGLLQEEEGLRFLQTEACFYKGDGFLLAARREGDRLRGIELLGDADRAPLILCSLGCAEGSFRTPGEGIPFAMYRPLRESPAPPPTYLGLAFD